MLNGIGIDCFVCIPKIPHPFGQTHNAIEFNAVQVGRCVFRQTVEHKVGAGEIRTFGDGNARRVSGGDGGVPRDPASCPGTKRFKNKPQTRLPRLVVVLLWRAYLTVRIQCCRRPVLGRFRERPGNAGCLHENCHSPLRSLLPRDPPQRHAGRRVGVGPELPVPSNDRVCAGRRQRVLCGDRREWVWTWRWY